ncbi:preprotein translocase subunit SecE [Pelistega sp. NLN82]|uniref:Protein translocase subunit SecE n=1 Tax=Pelistega ratti TaxID=2652177 RepID=A0A6L9Y6V7_9BURK|nr:preprotein translocase subunit SecE [Pelistega ratti]NEN75925.1 preprotein translocase subunit SecE [Pelistega ratti]
MSNNSQVETVSDSGEKLKVSLAIVFIVAGVFAYSFFTDFGLYARLGMFLGGLILSVVMLGISQTGKRMLDFTKGSYNEMKRVVWPTRKETIQMTGIVFVFVAIMAIFLWIVDKLITWAVYGQILGWN